MLSMPFFTLRALRAARGGARAAGLLALIVTAVAPAMALADTGGPYPQGYTGGVADSPQAPAPEADPADEYADTDPSALTDFRQPLDPHGSWVQDPTYGTVWVPNSAEVGPDFAPYQTAGHWATADSGEWQWESDYAWGAIPFHYGRWVWANSYWGWIPGRTYAPAWVTWRVGEGGYLGWAPLPPTWYWGNGYAVGLWTVPYAAYCFVPSGYAFYSNVSNYVVRDRGVVQHAAATTRPYHPATPGVGHGAVGAHAPQHAGRMSPTLSEAHIPPSAAPRATASANPQATAYATRSSTAAFRGNATATQGHTFGNVAPRPAGNAWHNSYDRSPNARSTGNARNGFDSASSARAPAFHDTATSARQAPSFHPAPSGYHGRPSFEVTHPAGSAAPGGYSAPGGYHGGGSASHATPAYHAPTHTTSAPARATGRSGGGFRGGGGHHR